MDKARVFSIQRFSTEDGPGIRTTVFFKGCPMRCTWCHNPEGIDGAPHALWYKGRCIGCMTCKELCKNGALNHMQQGIEIDRRLCKGCGECAEECPAEALELNGRTYGVDELVDMVMKDATFYETSNGGLTCSGGEAMVQADFLAKFLPRIKQQKVHVALDTCGTASPDRYDAVLPFVDLVLLDIKQMDPELHKQQTGVELERVLAAARHIDKSGIPIWVRTPLIPGYTDSEANLRAVAEFIRDEMKHVERFDLLAFSNLCSAKYEQLDMEWKFEKVPLMTASKLERLAGIVRAVGLDNVVTSGPTRREG